MHDSGAYKLSGITARDGMSWDELLAKAVRLPETSVHERFVIVASRSHLTPETEDYIEKMKCSHAEVELISSGSSIKICLVAEGKADVYPRFAPTMEWDTAAGHAIARAAGMEIYQAGKEEPLQYNKEDLLNPWFIVEPKHTEINNDFMTFEILFVLLALLGMVIALVLDKMRPGMVLFSVVVLFLCAGILTPKEMLEGFSNKGMMTVAMLFWSVKASGSRVLWGK